MPDFTKGLIYTIRTGDNVYVGSTTNFRRRKWEHKSHLYNENCKKYNQKIYQKIRENNYEWDMKPYKEYPCGNKTQLEIEEEKVRCELNNTINTNCCGTGLSKSEYQALYRIINQEKISNNSKYYREVNKDKLAEQQKQNYEKNKDKISKNNKQKVTCECGDILCRSSLLKHKKTKKHLDCMEKINSD
jgi:hypothetical protein